MAVNLQRTCDAVRDGARCGREATLSVDARVVETMFRGDLCPECKDRITQGFVQLGLTPTKATVGHSKRGAYVTASGKTFTAKEARAWLRQAGVDIAEVGKLTNEQLDLYAASH